MITMKLSIKTNAKLMHSWRLYYQSQGYSKSEFMDLWTVIIKFKDRKLKDKGWSKFE